MRKSMACWLILFAAWCLANGGEQVDDLESLPPPEVRIERPNAIYGHSFFHLYRKFKAAPSHDLCERLIKALERLLLEEPGGRFAPMPDLGGRMYLLDDSGGPLGTLSELYQFQGRYDEAVVVEIQRSLIMHHDAVLLDSVGRVFPSPYGDPPYRLRSSIDFVKQTLRKGIRVKPIIFVCGWPIRARWKGNEPEDAFVSLNDVAYALGGEKWRDVIHHDWKNWRFTLSLQGKTLSFSAGSQKGVISGKEVQLRHPVKRSFYNLYVPLGDLMRLVGGSLRPPKPDELEVFQRHLPVSLSVIELQ